MMKLALTLALGAALAGPAALAQEAKPNVPLQKAIGEVTQTGPVASLFVLNARGATLADGKLTLTGVSPSSIAFADRPVRAAGHIETAQFVEKWNEGEDQANIDPPNATVSVLSGANVADAVVTISAPVLEGDNLTFDAVVLEGALTGATGPAALFIDRGGFGGFHGGGGMMAGGFHGGGISGRADHFSNYAHVQDPHAAYYRSSDSGNRAVNYDPHNTYYGGGGYDGGMAIPGPPAPPAWRPGRDRRRHRQPQRHYANAYAYPYCGYPLPALQLSGICRHELCRGVPMAGARTWTRVAVAYRRNPTMHRLSLMLATACLVAAPAFAQEEVTCGDYPSWTTPSRWKPSPRSSRRPARCRRRTSSPPTPSTRSWRRSARTRSTSS